MKKYYIAYGSNMDERQMATRCRDAVLVGTGFIQGYELFFKGSLTGCYATIEPKAGSCVPVTLWTISRADEKRLDRYEGFPTFYYKKDVKVQTGNGTITGLVYIMHEDRHCGVPFPWYYATEYIPSFLGTPLFIFGWIFHGLVVIILIFLWWQSCKKRPEYKEFDDEE